MRQVRKIADQYARSVNKLVRMIEGLEKLLDQVSSQVDKLELCETLRGTFLNVLESDSFEGIKDANTQYRRYLRERVKKLKGSKRVVKTPEIAKAIESLQILGRFIEAWEGAQESDVSQEIIGIDLLVDGENQNEGLVIPEMIPEDDIEAIQLDAIRFAARLKELVQLLAKVEFPVLPKLLQAA